MEIGTSGLWKSTAVPEGLGGHLQARRGLVPLIPVSINAGDDIVHDGGLKADSHNLIRRQIILTNSDLLSVDRIRCPSLLLIDMSIVPLILA